MRFFCDTNRTGPYFEGWYLKHQNPQGQTLALIPAFHIDREGCRAASLQVILRDESWWLEYPQLQISRQPFQIQIGPSSFGRQGIALHVQRDGLSLHGVLRCGLTSWGRSGFSEESVFSRRHQHGAFPARDTGAERQTSGFLQRNRIHRDRQRTLLFESESSML